MKSVNAAIVAWLGSALIGSAAASDFSGIYALRGENPDGSRYTGQLQIRPLGPAWAVEWLQPSPAHGIGISDGQTLVVAFGGRRCGVVAWDISGDGGLDGQWTTDGPIGRETATPMASGRGLAGRYVVAGRNPDGSAYRGTLDLRADTGGYALQWQTGNDYLGTALEYGGVLAGAWGAGCGVVVYRLGDGGLTGIWRTPGNGTGRETLFPR